MMQDIQEYRKEIEKQQKTPSQEENWVTQDDIMQKYKMLEKIAKPLMKKESPSMSELQKIQNFIILSLLSGIHIPVRRSKDYVDFKIRNVDKTKDNYMSDDGKHLVFNSYKTAKAYGEQKIPLKTPLRNILRKWIAVNPSEYLLIDSSGAPLGGAERSGNGSVKLNQRLNKLFDNKKVGVNILRHSIMTEKFGDMMKKKSEAEKYMGQAGSSTDMLTTYVKED
jgi:integrase